MARYAVVRSDPPDVYLADDVYTNLHIYTEHDVPIDFVGAQLQFTPLFAEG